jgi:hypothetical protein
MVLFLIWATTAFSQQWTRGLFSETSHDFGVVPRAAKAEHAFVMTNTQRQDLHVRSVRSSCGCTTPVVVDETVRPGEQGTILARFNTRSFLGQRHATITVTFDRPYLAEVQLDVRGYVRRDVILNPGEVDFGQVPLSTAREQTVKVRYAGSRQWKLTGFKSSNSRIQARWQETHRERGSVEYELIVRLNETAEAGYVNEELELQTNDRLSNVRLMVTGQVVSPLTLSPSSMFMGVVQPGEVVTRRLVVRAAMPFRVTGIECPDTSFTFEKER